MDGNCYRQMAAKLQFCEFGVELAALMYDAPSLGRRGELIPVARFRLLLALLGELGLRLDSRY